MKFKLNKKVLLLSTVLVTTLAATSLIVVSCSNTSNPTIANALSFKLIEQGETEERTVSLSDKSVRINPEIEFDGQKFASMPATSTSDEPAIKEAKYKAIAYFNSLTNVIFWMQGFVSQVQDFLSPAPLSLRDYSAAEGLNISTSAIELGCGLGATINDGIETARLGLQSIAFSSNLWAAANTLKPTTAIETTEPAENPVANNVTDIKLNYAWWKTNSANEIIWMPDILSHSPNLTMWKNYIAAGINPQNTYQYAISNMSFDWSQEYRKNDAEGVITYIPTGVINILNPKNAFRFDNITGDADGKLTQDAYNFLVQLNKDKKGDNLNQDYWSFIKSDEQKSNLSNLIKVLS